MPMSYEQAIATNAIVHAGKKAGLTDREIIGFLCDELNGKDKTIDALSAIAPCAYKLPDGKVVIWRCPDELVPVLDIPSPQPSKDV